MPDYCFFQKGDQTIALEVTDASKASRLIGEGFTKQFEEVSAVNAQKALTRLEDIRRNNQIDHKNFLAGSIAMPWIGALTAFTTYLFRKKWFKHK